VTDHWALHALSGVARAAQLRWRTRHGFTVTDRPEFDPDATAWFCRGLGQVSRYIEYGSGASTLLAARGGVRTISMEGDPRYAQAVRRALPDGAPVDVLDAALGLTAEWSFPVFTRPTPARLETLRNYARRPLAMAAEQGWMPQLVLVDGRFRRSCALHVAQAIVAAGEQATLFFDDYVPRPHYHPVETYLGKPEIVGLSAVFEIGPDSPCARYPIPEETLAEAARDAR
jgi:hypothetical protein